MESPLHVVGERREKGGGDWKEGRLKLLAWPPQDGDPETHRRQSCTSMSTVLFKLSCSESSAQSAQSF